MSNKLTSKRVFWYAVVAGLAFIVLFAFVYPFVMVAVVPWYNKLIGVKEPTGEEPPTGYIYSGNLQITLPEYDVYDDSAKTPTSVVTKIWHADKATLFGSVTADGTDVITGEVTEADLGVLYMSVDHAATTTWYLDPTVTDANSNYLTEHFLWDVDDDGILEYGFKIAVTSLSPLKAGETQKAITIGQYFYDCDVTGLNIVAVTNPTSADLSGASYIDLYATGYVDAVTRGDGFKLVRVELTMPNAANETYVDDGKVKNVWVELAGSKGGDTYKWTTLSWQAGQDRYLVWEAQDVTQEAYGKIVFYDQNMGATDVSYKVHIQGANFAAAAVWNPTIKLTFINPAGTISTDTLAITFTDT